jgi:imidazole glycerol-phosphate synthase subunit HisH
LIAIIDYGMGNLKSVSKAFEHLGFQTVVTRDPARLKEAERIVLPGVGAFPDCMNNLKRFNLDGPIQEAIGSGKPFLGICLGLQLLFTESEEFGIHPGLGVIEGRVVRFGADPAHKVPHMGWNQLRIKSETPVLSGIGDDTSMYFVHSYYVVPKDSRITCTETEYGVAFTSGILRDNIFACQFHPEKSQAAGLRLLENFGRWSP